MIDFPWLRAASGYQWASARRVITRLGMPPEASLQTERFLMSAAPADSRSLAYSPLVANTGLFKRFAATSLDEDSIREFATEYGWLGGVITSEVVLTPPTKGEPFPHVIFAESFSDWAREIQQLSTLLGIWQAARNNPQLLADRIFWDAGGVFYRENFASGILEESIASSPETLERARFPATWSDELFKTTAQFPKGDLAGPAMYLLERHVNEQLRIHQVTAQLHRNPRGGPGICLSPSSLIGALWLQFALAIEGNKNYKQCQNCRDWIEVGGNRSARSDKRFCSPSCKSAFHRKNAEAGAGAKHLAEKE